ncbi:Alpha-tocopherol transfer protein [Armadillidium vulgare]|nr:Alpha-tocopherol transfer protein [Armadillidium vulgare]
MMNFMKTLKEGRRILSNIREWPFEQPHDLTARTDDWTILRFLRGCKFSLEKTKSKLDMFYTCKNLTPEWYANRDPLHPKSKRILPARMPKEKKLIFSATAYDKVGRKVVVIRAGLHDPNTTSMDEVFKATHMISDLLCEEDFQHSVTGISQVIDLAGVTASHSLQMTPALVKKAMTIWQDGYPIRQKAIHYINTPSFFQAVFSIFKTFMKEKIKKRVYVHGNNMESLYEHVPKNILPKEYGGSNGTVQDIVDYWCENVNKNRKWLLEDEKYKVDESKRPGKPKTSSELFGIEGSFRKLDVD